MDYFDGIKVGDKVYTAMGTPLMVCEVAMKCFDAKSYDSEEGRQIAFNFDGRLLDYEQLGQVVFWKPPPRFDPPPRPKRKVKKEGWTRRDAIDPCLFTTKESLLEYSPGCTPVHLDWEEEK